MQMKLSKLPPLNYLLIVSKIEKLNKINLWQYDSADTVDITFVKLLVEQKC